MKKRQSISDACIFEIKAVEILNSGKVIFWDLYCWIWQNNKEHKRESESEKEKVKERISLNAYIFESKMLQNRL